MINLKTILLTVLCFVFLGLFSSEALAVVTYGEWEDGSANAIINNGDSVNFNAVILTAQPPLDIDINLFDDQTNNLFTYEDIQFSNNFFSQTYTVLPTHYNTPGDYTIIISAKDGLNDEDFSVLYLKVLEAAENNAPVLNPIGDKQVCAGDLLQFTVSANDPDNDILTFTASNLPPGATFTQIDNNNALFSWQTIDPDDIGSYTLTFQVTDGVDTDLEIITIEVLDCQQEQPPVLDLIGDKQVCAGNLLEFDITSNDPDTTVLNFNAIGLPSGATFTRVDDTTYRFSWQTIDPDDIGTYIATFEVTDGTFTDSETITINVEDCQVDCSGNLPPVFNRIRDIEVDEGELLEFTVTATDPNNDILEFFAVDLPEGATFTQLDNNNAVFSWTPDFDIVSHNSNSLKQKILNLLGFKQLEKEFKVTFIVKDECGAVDIETITITVNDINRNPVLEPRPVPKFVCAGQLIQYKFTATDSDNDILTFTASNLPPGATFTQIDNNNALFSWQTIDPDDIGRYDIIIKVEDKFGGSDSQTLVITIRGCSEFNAPVLNPIGDKQVCANNLIEFTITATDPNNDNLVFTATPLPKGALFTQLDNNNALFSWKPDNDQKGLYTITFNVTDGFYTDSETITITVSALEECTIIKGEVDRVSVSSVMIDPENVKSGDYILIYTKTRNTGNKDESIELKLTIMDLGIVESKFFKLDEDKITSNVFEVKIPENTPKGEYFVIVKAFNSKASDSRFMTFEVI